jgi:hypothetical protein
MGGGKEKSSANQQLDEAAQWEKQKRDRFDQQNTQDLADSKQRTSGVYDTLLNRYTSLAGGGGPSTYSATGGADQMAAAKAAGFKDTPVSGSSSGGGGGGVPGQPGYNWREDPRFSAVDKKYADFMDTGGVEMDRLRRGDSTYDSVRDNGGYDPEMKATLTKNLDTIQGIGGELHDFGAGGINREMSPEVMARMRGGGVFDEFAKTGGFNDRDIQNIRARANSAVPSTFGRIKDEANRQSAISGGYGPGKAALMGRLGRDQTAAEGDTRLGTEIGIKNQVNAGRQWGGTSMAGSEGVLQAQLSDRERAAAGMRMESLRGAADVTGQAFQGRKGMADTMTGNRLQATDLQGRQELNSQGMRQSGMQFGSQGLQSRSEGDRAYERQVLESDRAAAMASGANSAANDRWQQEFDFRKEQAGLEGLGSLYSSNPTEYQTNKNFDLQNRQQGTSGITNPADSRLRGNQGTDYPGMLSGVTSALPSFLPFGGGKNKTQTPTPTRAPAPAGSSWLAPNYPDNPSGGYPDPRTPIPGAPPPPPIPGQPDFPNGPPPGTYPPSSFLPGDNYSRLKFGGLQY